jgi:TolA-binding protein
MKRTERQHLKENELERLARQAQDALTKRRREVTAGVVVLAILGAVALGYYAWHDRVESKAHALLADALAMQDARVGPPAAPGTPNPTLSFPTERERSQAALTKFTIAADAYPSTDAGLYARYEAAATEMALGDASAAAAAYQQVITRGGSSVYVQMAHLGLAEAQARSGQFDQAINTFKELAQRKDGPLPVDAILMQLGRTYLDAGKRTEAQQTFTRLVQEYPNSPFNGDAKKELDGLKKT